MHGRRNRNRRRRHHSDLALYTRWHSKTLRPSELPDPQPLTGTEYGRISVYGYEKAGRKMLIALEEERDRGEHYNKPQKALRRLYHMGFR
jgi:hypothetical protein